MGARAFGSVKLLAFSTSVTAGTSRTLFAVILSLSLLAYLPIACADPRLPLMRVASPVAVEYCEVVPEGGLFAFRVSYVLPYDVIIDNLSDRVMVNITLPNGFTIVKAYGGTPLYPGSIGPLIPIGPPANESTPIHVKLMGYVLNRGENITWIIQAPEAIQENKSWAHYSIQIDAYAEFGSYYFSNSYDIWVLKMIPQSPLYLGPGIAPPTIIIDYVTPPPPIALFNELEQALEELHVAQIDIDILFSLLLVVAVLAFIVVRKERKKGFPPPPPGWSEKK